MNWDTVAGNWKQMKGKAKQKWAKLTDDDLIISTASASSFSGVSRSATASRRISPKGSSEGLGTHALERRGFPHRAAAGAIFIGIRRPSAEESSPATGLMPLADK